MGLIQALQPFDCKLFLPWKQWWGQTIFHDPFCYHCKFYVTLVTNSTGPTFYSILYRIMCINIVDSTIILMKIIFFSLLESIVICKISSTEHSIHCLPWKFFPGPPSCHEGSWHLPQRARGARWLLAYLICAKSYLMIATPNLWYTNIFSISFLAIIYRLIHLLSSELFYLR